MQSTNILNIKYDVTKKSLTVHFFGGGAHEYEQVPYNVYDDMLRAKSRGQYFNEKVKDLFKSKKVY